MSKQGWTKTAEETGSRRRFAIALGLAALILAVLTLVGPAVTPSRALDDIDSSSAGGADSTPPEYDFFVDSHAIGKGKIKEGATVVCNGALAATETTVKDCTEGAYTGTSISYTAAAEPGYTFVGWSGACTGTGTCTLRMDGDKDVTARFMDDIAPAAPAIDAPLDGAAPVLSSTGGVSAKATSSDATVDHINCSVDGTPVGCVSGTSFTTPAAETGSHTISVTATDLRGFVSTATTRGYKVVRKSTASVSGVPAENSVTAVRTTSVAISGDHGATLFQCRLAEAAAWSTCPVPLSAANLGALENSGTGQLSEGAKALRVRAGVSFEGQDYYGDPSPAFHWTVDVTKPVTTVTGGPDAGDISNKRTVTFTFTQADANPGTFQCALDRPTFGTCPGGVAGKATYSNLSFTAHTFKVQSVDKAGNVEAQPVTRSWRVTADGDGDGSNVPDDCNDDAPGIHPGAVDPLDDGIDQNCDGDPGVNRDRDGDGVQVGTDCDDTNPGIKPGAYDKPGDTIDQDCSGSPADYLRPGTSLSSSWTVLKGRTIFPVFRISGAPKGAKVVVSCAGKGCTFKSKKIKLRGGKADLRKLVKPGIRVGTGATIDVRTTVTDMLISVIRTKVAKDGRAKNAKLCLRPGSKKIFSCG